MEQVRRALKSEAYNIPSSEKYKRSIEDFIEDTVVAGMVRLREKYEMYGAEEFEEAIEDLDMNLQADSRCRALSVLTELELIPSSHPEPAQIAVDNLSRVTEKQLAKFLEICCERYLRARIEPGR